MSSSKVKHVQYIGNLKLFVTFKVLITAHWVAAENITLIELSE